MPLLLSCMVPDRMRQAWVVVEKREARARARAGVKRIVRSMFGWEVVSSDPRGWCEEGVAYVLCV